MGLAEADKSISTTSCICSMIGCLFIIGTYYAYEDLRKPARKLLLFLSISDLLTAITYLTNEWACPGCDCNKSTQRTLGLLGVYFPVASFLWTDCIGLYVYGAAYQKSWIAPRDKLFQAFHIVCWTIPALLCIILITLNDNVEYSAGTTGGWCWIKNFGYELLGGKIVEVCSYIFLIIIYVATWSKLRALKTMSEPVTEYILRDAEADEDEYYHTLSPPSFDGNKKSSLRNEPHKTTSDGNADMNQPNETNRKQSGGVATDASPKQVNIAASPPRIAVLTAPTVLNPAGGNGAVENNGNGATPPPPPFGDDDTTNGVKKTQKSKKAQKRSKEFAHKLNKTHVNAQILSVSIEHDNDTPNTPSSWLTPQQSYGATATQPTQTGTAFNFTTKYSPGGQTPPGPDTPGKVDVVTTNPKQVPVYASDPRGTKSPTKNLPLQTPSRSRMMHSEHNRDTRNPPATPPRHKAIEHKSYRILNNDGNQPTQQRSPPQKKRGKRKSPRRPKKGTFSSMMHREAQLINRRKLYELLFRLFLIPLIFILIRIWGTTRMFCNEFIHNFNGVPFEGFLRFMQAFFDPSQGWCNAILFVAFVSPVREHLQMTLERRCCSPLAALCVILMCQCCDFILCFFCRCVQYGTPYNAMRDEFNTPSLLGTAGPNAIRNAHKTRGSARDAALAVAKGPITSPKPRLSSFGGVDESNNAKGDDPRKSTANRENAAFDDKIFNNNMMQPLHASKNNRYNFAATGLTTAEGIGLTPPIVGKPNTIGHNTAAMVVPGRSTHLHTTQNTQIISPNNVSSNLKYMPIYEDHDENDSSRMTTHTKHRTHLLPNETATATGNTSQYFHIPTQSQQPATGNLGSSTTALRARAIVGTLGNVESTMEYFTPTSMDDEDVFSQSPNDDGYNETPTTLSNADDGDERYIERRETGGDINESTTDMSSWKRVRASDQVAYHSI